MLYIGVVMFHFFISWNTKDSFIYARKVNRLYGKLVVLARWLYFYLGSAHCTVQFYLNIYNSIFLLISYQAYPYLSFYIRAITLQSSELGPPTLLIVHYRPWHQVSIDFKERRIWNTDSEHSVIQFRLPK